MELAKKLHHGIEMQYRPGTHDQYVFGEATGYLKVPIREDDVVLDVGAHIGAFTALAVAEGASKIIAYEPHPESFTLLRVNLKKFKQVKMVRAAVLGTSDSRTTVEFFLQADNTSGHSIHHFRGRNTTSVPAISISQVFSEERITYMKLDCEGSEYDLLINSKPLPKSVRCVTMEIHFGKKAWKDAAKVLDARMLEQGFRHAHAPNLNNQSLWHTNATYQRGK